MTWPIVSMVIKVEADIVAVRQRARHLAQLLGFERQDQTRIATAVSEIARNAYSYAGGGRVEFNLLEANSPQLLLIRIADRGGGIADLDQVLEGRYQSQQGMGLGITGARKLLDHFKIETSRDGTQVELGHKLPPRAAIVTRELLAASVARLQSDPGEDPLTALRDQNRELLQSLEEIRRRQDEAAELNRELGDTNRGVVALYAELDERAEQLRQASETKSRFLSNMSHEFRTPLNSIMALSRLLLDRVDGDLNPEQDKQIGYIRRSAEDLLDLVNDLLDLAKVEAGKIETRPTEFVVADLFGGLRGALRPLRADGAVALIFEPATDLPALYTDEGKVTQILRNFISNALKFTEQGAVHISAHYDSRAATLTFAVADTGIGIAAHDQERIFEEFTQIDGPLQRAAKGTGLGLPLSRKLAELLHGEVWAESEPGVGSTFYLTVPVELAPRRVQRPEGTPAPRRKLLLIDDDETFRYVLRQIVNQDARYDIVEAVDGERGLQAIREQQPDVVMLDLQMPRLDGFAVVDRLKSDPTTRSLPLIVATSLHLTEQLRARLPARIPILSKHALSRERVLALLLAATGD